MATLYRTYRPQLFSDVIGQEHVTNTLLSALREGKLSHAYLFCGPRGVGKTTVARLLAKALDCTAKDKPCGKCQNCLDIASGRFIDLVEIDAASNRGIDEIRQLREKVRFAPVIGPKKIYIIDEVHMLTKDAFNALLKTLEEPPEHTVFVLATTEAHKVLPTVISRCQRFDFKKATDDNLDELIKKIAKSEHIKLESDHIQSIVNLADGSFRDALSILDQLSASLKADNPEEAVKSILGLSGTKYVLNFIDALKSANCDEVFNLIDEIINRGLSLEFFIKSVTLELRKEMIKLAVAGEDIKWHLSAIEEMVRSANMQGLSSLPSLSLELGALKIISLSRLPASPAPVAALAPQTQAQDEKPAMSGEKPAKATSKISCDIPILGAEAKGVFVEMLSKKNKTLATIVADAKWESSPDKIKFLVDFDFHKNQIEKAKSKEILDETFHECFNKRFAIECEVAKERDLTGEIDDVFGIA